MLPHRIGRSLIPGGRFVGLLGGQDFDIAAAEGVKGVSAANVPMEADRVELGHHVDPLHATVDAVRQRHVDDPVLTGERDGRFRAITGQRIKPGAPTTAQNQGQHVLDTHAVKLHYPAQTTGIP